MVSQASAAAAAASGSRRGRSSSTTGSAAPSAVLRFLRLEEGGLRVLMLFPFTLRQPAGGSRIVDASGIGVNKTPGTAEGNALRGLQSQR